MNCVEGSKSAYCSAPSQVCRLVELWKRTGAEDGKSLLSGDLLDEANDVVRRLRIEPARSCRQRQVSVTVAPRKRTAAHVRPGR